MSSEDRVLLAGQSAVGHPGWQKGWDGGQRRSPSSISLHWNRIEACQRSIRPIGNEQKNEVGKGKPHRQSRAISFFPLPALWSL